MSKIKQTDLYSEPHTVSLEWKMTGIEWTLIGGLFSSCIRICRPSPHSRFRIMFNDFTLATTLTLTEAKHCALTKMATLLFQEYQVCSIHRHYADNSRRCLKRWKDGKI